MEQLCYWGRRATAIAWVAMIINLMWPLPLSDFITLLLLVTVTAHLTLAMTTLFYKRQGLVAVARVLLFGVFEFFRPQASDDRP
ncbi:MULTISPECIES: DUF1145 domain-containing protein [Ferrimonas]|uniref:DUF1145 domain-containing protein n=1 Tax=Ferrimonas TaxID=44011 RepID=UPI00041259DB|nr:MULTISPECIES: DUF1145 domain-containing protein [Ferrimonas]USD37565.1 DUF1145 domain-containing protein [Ferrimonas sp. SCSIO 43195]